MKIIPKAAFACFAVFCGLGSLAFRAEGAEGNKRGKAAATVQKNFRKGQEAYEAKRYEEAEALLNPILVKQPDHIPTKTLLVRVLYQLKKLPEANTICQDLDIATLDPDTSYECGQAAFRSNNFGLALPAFKNIPNGHTLYDLAGYYGGISAFKKGEFQTAVDMLQQAVVLPSKLVRSQKLYRKEAERQLLIQQKQELRAGAEIAANGSVRSIPETPYSILNNRSAVALVPQHLVQTSESEKLVSEEHAMTSTELRLDVGSKTSFSRGSNHRLWRIGLSAASVRNAEDEIPVLPSPEQSMRLAVAKAHQPESLISGRLEGAYEWSLGVHSSTGVKLGAFAVVADADFVKSILYAPYLHLFIAQKNEFIRTFFAVEAYPQFDDEKQQVSETRQLGRVGLALPEEFFLNLRGELSEFSYNVKVDGPNWTGRMFLDLSYGEDELFAFGTFAEIANGWRLHQIRDYSVISFDQQQVGFFAKAAIPLTSFWSFGADGRVLQRSFSQIEPTSAESVSDYVPTKITQISVYTEIFKSF